MDIKISEKVTVSRSVRAERGAPAETVSWEFDLSGLTSEQVEKLVLDSLVVRAQARYRAMTGTDQKEARQTTWTATKLVGNRRRLDPKDRIARAAFGSDYDGLSTEQKSVVDSAVATASGAGQQRKVVRRKAGAGQQRKAG